jgi:dipeptidyl aminopeptidase/acylaminoacyl peptidase
MLALSALLIAPIQVHAQAEMTPMRTVGKDECSKIARASNADVSGVLPTTDIELFKVRYETTNFDGKSEKASRLYAKPSGADGNGTALYFHGTVAGRGDVPSQEYNLLETCLFAGQGFAFLAADYIGLGDSTVEAPYFHREATVNAGLDLVRAVDKLVDLDKRLFVVGYSQGGHGALSATREVDLNGLEGFRFVSGSR